MCKCTPEMRTSFCGKPGPKQGEEKILEEYQKRVLAEKAELDKRVKAISGFLAKGEFNALPGDERERLIRQLGIMVEYSDVLTERIAHF